jgi:hypothetical protein
MEQHQIDQRVLRAASELMVHGVVSWLSSVSIFLCRQIDLGRCSFASSVRKKLLLLLNTIRSTYPKKTG